MTIPNLVTISGFVFIFFYVWNFLSGGANWISFFFLFLAGFSDALDGFLARRLNQESLLGSILDPLRDRVILVAILWNFCLVDSRAWKAAEIIIFCEIIISSTWYFRLGFPKNPFSRLNHILGKTRQAGHLIFGGLGVIGLMGVDTAISVIAGFSFGLMLSQIASILGSVLMLDFEA